MKRSGNIFYCEPHEIQVEEGFNARFDYGNIDDLANSIIANGVKIPLRGVKVTGEDKFILTDGHRRFKAIQKAYKMGFTEIRIPIISESKQSEEERILSMVTFNSGKPFEMLEEADIYQRLTNYGWSANEIGKKVGKSGQFVRDCLLLNTSSMVLKTQIRDKKISASEVVVMLRKNEDAGAVENKVMRAIKQNDGNKVSRKHIAPTKPKQADLYATIGEISDASLQAKLKFFIEYQTGEMSKHQFLTKIGERETV